MRLGMAWGRIAPGRAMRGARMAAVVKPVSSHPEPMLAGPPLPEDEPTSSGPCPDPHLVCELDVRTDPVQTLQQLRKCLWERGSARLQVADSRPALLLDALGLLHLLNEDLRLEEDFSTTVFFFQPLLNDQPGSHGMSLHVTKLRAPGLLQQLPSSVVAPVSGLRTAADGLAPIARSATMSEVWGMADELVQRLEEHAMAQLRADGPRSLVVAFRAVMRARKLLQLAGEADLLVSPHIVTEKGRAVVCFNVRRWWRKATTPAPAKAAAEQRQEERPSMVDSW